MTTKETKETPQLPLPTERAQLLARLSQPHVFDLAVVGGGATGLGVALDAAARGLSVLLLESHDFAQGTSSRATKLVHGGVRYLAQGKVALVREALHERVTLLRNAPHLATPLAFVMPCYQPWEVPFYGLGLQVYDALAGQAGLGAMQCLGRAQTQRCLPTVAAQGLVGGVKYWDGQFDDARLALALARTAAREGALLLNHCRVTGLLYENDLVTGLVAQDAESDRRFEVRARCVVNATGVWVDELRRQDEQALGQSPQSLVTASQGVHIVVDRDFLPTDHALIVPRTTDGRVLFAVPWLGKLILGTTDTPRQDLAREPRPMPEEVAFILGEAAHCLQRAPGVGDVRSIWAGLRPLVRPPGAPAGKTSGISREHLVRASRSGLVTVAGGKWTTYRAMAEDVLAVCMDLRLLPHRPAGATVALPLVGATDAAEVSLSAPPGLHVYGSEAATVAALPGADQALAPGLSEAMVRFAVRHEYARTVEDVLARRSRMLFLDAQGAASLAPRVAAILQEESPDCDPQLAAFLALAQQYARVPDGV